MNFKDVLNAADEKAKDQEAARARYEMKRKREILDLSEKMPSHVKKSDITTWRPPPLGLGTFKDVKKEPQRRIAPNPPEDFEGMLDLKTSAVYIGIGYNIFTQITKGEFFSAPFKMLKKKAGKGQRRQKYLFLADVEKMRYQRQTKQKRWWVV